MLFRKKEGGNLGGRMPDQIHSVGRSIIEKLLLLVAKIARPEEEATTVQCTDILQYIKNCHMTVSHKSFYSRADNEMCVRGARE